VNREETHYQCNFHNRYKLEETPGLCPGDSGGPLFAKSPSGTEEYRIVGVNSNYHESGASTFVRVDSSKAKLGEWVTSASK
jgi:hypothetical protein